MSPFLGTQNIRGLFRGIKLIFLSPSTPCFPGLRGHQQDGRCGGSWQRRGGFRVTRTLCRLVQTPQSPPHTRGDTSTRQWIDIYRYCVCGYLHRFCVCRYLDIVSTDILLFSCPKRTSKQDNFGRTKKSNIFKALDKQLYLAVIQIISCSWSEHLLCSSICVSILSYC